MKYYIATIILAVPLLCNALESQERSWRNNLHGIEKLYLLINTCSVDAYQETFLHKCNDLLYPRLTESLTDHLGIPVVKPDANTPSTGPFLEFRIDINISQNKTHLITHTTVWSTSVLFGKERKVALFSYRSDLYKYPVIDDPDTVAMHAYNNRIAPLKFFLKSSLKKHN